MKEIKKIQYITQAKTKEGILDEAKDVLEGGCRWIQLRMKNADNLTILDTAKELKNLCRQYNATLIINDNALVCRDVDADGVHLGKMDIPTIVARRIIGEDKIIGRTANTLEDVMNLETENIDYIGLGPCRYTTTKDNLSPVIGIEGYNEIINISRTKLPIIAVGGIVESDIKPLTMFGVYGYAISGAIYNSEDRVAATMQITKNLF